LEFRPFTIFEHQGAGRTDNNALPTFLASEVAKGLIGKGGNHSLKAAVGKAEDTYSQTLPTYPDTTPAEHAFIRVIDK